MLSREWRARVAGALGVLAALIALFVFVSGKQSLPEMLRSISFRLWHRSQPAAETPKPAPMKLSLVEATFAFARPASTLR